MSMTYAMEQRNELKAAFICAVQQTRIVKAACAITGTPETTINNWRDKDSAFKKQLTQARQLNTKMNTTKLTGREIEILQLMTLSISRREIAARLNYSFHTIDARMASMFKKLNVHTAQQAVAAALSAGLVTL